MEQDTKDRAAHEIAHGKLIAESSPELVWGWGTPAGKLRSKRRGQLVAEAANLGEGMRALEIGCGSGLFTEIFAGSGALIVAVDISPDLIELAQQRDLPEDRVTFLCQRFEEISLAEPFDAVIGSSVLHHLEIDEALKVIYRLLKPGGVLAFAEPNMLNPQVFAERTFFRRFSKYTSPDETAFVRWSFQALLEGIGFTRVEVTPFDWLHPYTPKVMIPAVRGLGRVLEKIPAVREFSGSLLIRAERG
jgi:2-polyprenyl-3-methyl-5-hydroxy-6-metoxy-1,4-benzoquinol methylase